MIEFVPEYVWFMDDPKGYYTIDKLALKAELWSSQEIKVN
jgi:hypothetical protein